MRTDENYSEHCCILQRNVVERVNPKGSHHKGKILSFLKILYLYEMMNVY